MFLKVFQVTIAVYVDRKKQIFFQKRQVQIVVKVSMLTEVMYEWIDA